MLKCFVHGTTSAQLICGNLCNIDAFFSPLLCHVPVILCLISSYYCDRSSDFNSWLIMTFKTAELYDLKLFQT